MLQLQEWPRSASALHEYIQAILRVILAYKEALPRLEAEWNCEAVSKRNAKRVRLAIATFNATFAALNKGCTSRVAWEGELELFSRELGQCSFWNPLQTRENPVVLLLSKALPQPCQIREIADKTLNEMLHHPWFAIECRKWIDCFLLGLYSHCGSSPNRKRMGEFFDLIRDPVRHEHLHHWLLTRQDALCCFIIRAYLIYLLPFDPPLASALRSTCAWDLFTNVIHGAIGQLHQQINNFGWSVLFLGDPPGSMMLQPTSKRRKLSEGPGYGAGHVSGGSSSATPKRRKRTAKSATTTAVSKGGGGRNATNDECDPEAQRSQEWNETADRLGRDLDIDLYYAHVPDHHSKLLACLDMFDAVWSAAEVYVSTPTTTATAASTRKTAGGGGGGGGRKRLMAHTLLPRSTGPLIQLLQIASQALAEEQESKNGEQLLMHRLRCMWDLQKLHQEQRWQQEQPPPRPTDVLGFMQHSQQFEMQPCFYSRTQASFLDLVNSSRKNATGKKKGVVQLGQDLLQELSNWVERAVYNNMNESKGMQLLAAFGAPEPALQQIQNLKITYDDRTQGRKAIMQRFRQLGVHYPLTCALLHAFAPLWKRNSEFRIAPLPRHYVVNQIKAIRGRFRLKEDDPIPTCACFLLVCRVCENVYSLYNEYGDAKHCMNPAECYGYSGVRRDLMTGEMQCRKEVSAHVDFPEAKLSQVLILGNIVQFAGKQWILCPQPNCSMPCVVNYDPRYFNEHGFICSFHNYTPPPPRTKGKKKTKSKNIKPPSLASSRAK